MFTAAATTTTNPSPLSSLPRKKMRIAVVGGGITGSVVASELAKVFAAAAADDDDGSQCCQVVVFDQGRRGPGGRASHRSVIAKKTDDGEKEEFIVLPDDDIDESAFQFDHGCQFFRADSRPMKDLVETWLQNGWVAPWKARFGSLPQVNENENDDTVGSYDHNDNKMTDFFGLPSNDNDNDDNNDVYIGVGGMHLLPRRILNSSKAIVHPGTRVSGVTRRRREDRITPNDNDNGNDNDNVNDNFVWDVTTTVGAAAFHDTKESEATAALAKATAAVETEEAAAGTGTPTSATTKNSSSDDDTTRVVVHRGFDAVIFTDISSSSDSWHRASAGIPTTFTSRLPPKLRLPLFSCMIALKNPLKDRLPFDAFTAKSSTGGPLWFAARSDSKPGFPSTSSSSSNTDVAECWTLISTPSFAVDEIRQTTMRDPVTGAFRPQENEYLNSVPGPALKDAFFDLVKPYLFEPEEEQPLYYLQGQRWGSGLPIDPERVSSDDVEEICGTRYASKVKGGSIVYPPSCDANSDDDGNTNFNFVADDDKGLYYGGDFCSSLNPGIEAAALSGFDLARHIIINQREHSNLV